MASEPASSPDWITPSIRDAGFVRRFAAGEILFQRGDPCNGVYDVIGGKLRLSVTAANGRELVVQTATAGETFAESSVFTPTYQCDAVAVTETEAVFYPKSRMFAEFEQNPRAAFAFMTMLARKIGRLRTRLERQNLRSARDRVRHFLAANVGEDDDHTVVITGSLKDLALELGLTHEALYRAIAELEAAGEIERLKNKIRLKQPAV